MPSPGEFLANLLRLWWGAITLDPAAYQAATSQPGGLADALLIAVIGGISLGLGQSAVLFINRIPRRRFIYSLLAGALVYAFSIVLWAATIWFCLDFALDPRPSFHETLALVCLSFAPLVFAFLILLPYFGNLFYYLLFTWVLGNLLLALRALYGLNLLEAAVAAGIGWLAVQIIAHTRLVERLLGWLLPEYARPLDVEQVALDYARTIGR